LSVPQLDDYYLMQIKTFGEAKRNLEFFQPKGVLYVSTYFGSH
jgi:hypothetical protein